jgi:regulator of protease activity HflC (stomatin/prohibitin superfamily)
MREEGNPMRETTYPTKPGLPLLILAILLYIGMVSLFIRTVTWLDHREISEALGGWLLFGTGLIALIAVLVHKGLFMIQPNEARVLLLFGKYVGTTRREGFNWANPFFTKKRISLRMRNMNGEKLKVNDHSGNPIEIALVLVWKVEDTFAACFEVDDYINYVMIQSESALRHLASIYPYDSWEEDQAVSLRGNIDQVSAALEKELQERFGKAGVKVLEARLSHLAYAPEIAEAMLRRQQASAIIAARSKIVEGAVGMVRMALERLAAEHVIELDDERKASMVSNLLVVLCGESNAQPVLNAGTLYH